MTTITVCTPETHAWVNVSRDFDICRDCRQSRVTGGTPVAAYGRYGQFTIVRHDGSKRTDRFYTIVDRDNRPVGKNWTFLRNARKQAAHMASPAL